MRERFAKKREPVWCDWAEGREREWEGGWRGDDVRMDTARKMETDWGEKELLTSGLDRRGEEEGAYGDLTWCGETFLFHVQPLSMGVHSWLLLVLCSSSVTHSKRSLFCLTMPNIQYTHMYKHTHTQKHKELSSTHCHRAYICFYERSLIAQELVCHRKNVKLAEIAHF